MPTYQVGKINMPYESMLNMASRSEFRYLEFTKKNPVKKAKPRRFATSGLLFSPASLNDR
ncbi:hypothetical protein C1Y08_25145 [Pseudomonas sp. FW306-02-F02-AA]|uniref:Uncharacterized protein n=1 Tax=Pseudomonas fluorescens TaxID=294 RepID=A0A0N9WM15_PSEFL|nr:hypothetical protein AO353_26095 [Pseudomonas fluorescens]PMZ01619.1 hypothetical protein C1Y07_23970 [Pseudomonas sp. FW306-02-F02-AB]PMZ10170.1 hypothetical protein C1Y06_11140 [Pseudomonas sp. FW306-02-H06C]PMZ13229.1 hypothetical protein C1Y08_25145 [Pseudomonas sp. FW306-02-F02-AA]PMZ19272.1 hypothetical protein C1Y09_25210 [Pseudomonas sp. FW306-02-F08-AA]PMZ27069.1 hypothetical protein C1Y05_15760 [Pseudomonas sp. FW306-02-F04-BA]PMZ31683.1 hypothetical protein C1X99_25455 [Pseudomo